MPPGYCIRANWNCVAIGWSLTGESAESLNHVIETVTTMATHASPGARHFVGCNCCRWPLSTIIYSEKLLAFELPRENGPNVVDRYLAEHGCKAQQTDEPDDHNRPHNLWNALPGDFGAHGRFDRQSRRRSWQLWLTTHRAWLGSAAIGAAAAAIGAYTIRRWSSTQSSSGLVRTVLPRVLKWPARDAPSASSKRETG